MSQKSPGGDSLRRRAPPPGPSCQSGHLRLRKLRAVSEHATEPQQENRARDSNKPVLRWSVGADSAARPADIIRRQVVLHC